MAKNPARELTGLSVEMPLCSAFPLGIAQMGRLRLLADGALHAAFLRE